MALDPKQVAADVVAVVKSALAPVHVRVALLETKVAAMPTPVPVVEDEPEALAASFTGLLQKELTALLPTRTVKRLEHDADGRVERVIEEST